MRKAIKRIVMIERYLFCTVLGTGTIFWEILYNFYSSNPNNVNAWSIFSKVGRLRKELKSQQSQIQVDVFSSYIYTVLFNAILCNGLVFMWVIFSYFVYNTTIWLGSHAYPPPPPLPAPPQVNTMATSLDFNSKE